MTEQQRIAAEKAALRQRVEDIACGACGGIPECFKEGCFTLFSDFTPSELGNFFMALERLWPDIRTDSGELPQFTRPWYFETWERPWPEVIDKLYEGGLRA